MAPDSFPDSAGVPETRPKEKPVPVPGDTLSLEKQLLGKGYQAVAGLDEAGRGPLAGPVVAGAVILPSGCDHTRFKDSKKLAPRRRQLLFTYLRDCGATIGIGIVSARRIEEINILQASLLAMKRAVQQQVQAGLAPDYLLVDGKFSVPIDIPQQTIVKGESASASIAAASIVAKVTRDEIMAGYHERFPAYNFIQNQGYPTGEHRRAIAEHGPCEIHRRTFKGVREYFDD